MGMEEAEARLGSCRLQLVKQNMHEVRMGLSADMATGLEEREVVRVWKRGQGHDIH